MSPAARSISPASSAPAKASGFSRAIQSQSATRAIPRLHAAANPRFSGRRTSSMSEWSVGRDARRRGRRRCRPPPPVGRGLLPEEGGEAMAEQAAGVPVDDTTPTRGGAPGRASPGPRSRVIGAEGAWTIRPANLAHPSRIPSPAASLCTGRVGPDALKCGGRMASETERSARGRRVSRVSMSLLEIAAAALGVVLLGRCSSDGSRPFPSTWSPLRPALVPPSSPCGSGEGGDGPEGAGWRPGRWLAAMRARRAW